MKKNLLNKKQSKICNIIVTIIIFLLIALWTVGSVLSLKNTCSLVTAYAAEQEIQSIRLPLKVYNAYQEGEYKVLSVQDLFFDFNTSTHQFTAGSYNYQNNLTSGVSMVYGMSGDLKVIQFNNIGCILNTLRPLIYFKPGVNTWVDTPNIDGLNIDINLQFENNNIRYTRLVISDGLIQYVTSSNQYKLAYQASSHTWVGNVPKTFTVLDANTETVDLDVYNSLINCFSVTTLFKSSDLSRVIYANFQLQLSHLQDDLFSLRSGYWYVNADSFESVEIYPLSYDSSGSDVYLKFTFLKDSSSVESIWLVRGFDFALYNVGYTYSSVNSSSFEQGYSQGIKDREQYGNQQYLKGKADGIESANTYSFTGLFTAIFDVPIQTLFGLLNIEILGVNLYSFFTGLLTLALIIFVIKLVI